ncbi:DUF600 domain-containing protein [Photobacterium kishitanii]|uniref:immunity protein YezG family protein n=1 Tax=Photobacterium kishitanii TaxID=318456 RepID=UPI0007EF3BDB|nr:immunity protein YezG family protein [Photobacterium kishitanii]OBU29060.1 hypothetical protein AYY22_00545 [Photobacterium kishitanii]PSW69385.1 DUF600 domain-containing protein [Photobacterium kishitanii]
METFEDIYQHIGQAMFNALPDEWDSAYFYISIKLIYPRACEYKESYFLKGVEFDFSVDENDGDYGCTDTFFELYDLMQKDDSDVPWNKARFELKPDGSFDIQFKYDEDFAWLKSLNLRRKKIMIFMKVLILILSTRLKLGMVYQKILTAIG